jgi:4-amino-4-deoxy-L-arabinose transferase-like glycosyltransferase
MPSRPSASSARPARLPAGRSVVGRPPATGRGAPAHRAPRRADGTADDEPPASDERRRRPALAWGPVLALVLATVAGHVAVNVWSPYGIHRDELLYLAMGRHLRLLAMDFPPFIALLAEVTRMLLGDALWAIRLGPAVAHALLAFLAAAMARELGGGRGAQGLAAGAVVASPLFLRAGTLFQPVVFDQLWWTVGFFALLRLGRHALVPRARQPGALRANQERRRAGARPAEPATTAVVPLLTSPTVALPAVLEPLDIGEGLGYTPLYERRRAATDLAAGREWTLLGVALGLGLLTKFSIAFFALPLVVAVLATPLRRGLLRPWPWLALIVALVLGAPSVVGQLALDWPVRGQMADLQAAQLARVGPAEFLEGQVLMLGPSVLLAALGLWALLVAPAVRRGRAAGLTALGALVLLLVLHGKAYYAGPVYPLLLAAGATALARVLPRAVPGALARVPRGLRLGVPAVVIALAGLATLPLGLPVLPPALMARYGAKLGIGTRTNTGGHLALPQDYADMLGWPQLAVAAANAWAALPPERRENAAVLADNYGEAGALDFYGPALGLPRVVSPVGSFWFFGPGDRAGDPLLTVGVTEADLRPYCTRIVPLPPVRHAETPWLVPEEQDVPLAWCEGPRATLQELWPRLRGQN